MSYEEYSKYNGFQRLNRIRLIRALIKGSHLRRGIAKELRVIQGYFRKNLFKIQGDHGGRKW